MSTRFATSDEAEQAFYEALERGDLDAMMAVWAEDEEVACIHPGGSRLNGLDEVRESWRRILGGGPALRFRINQRQIWRGALLAVHCVWENITVAGGNTTLVLATNAYLLTARGWRMVLHHASPAPGEDPGPEDEDDGPPPLLH